MLFKFYNNWLVQFEIRPRRYSSYFTFLALLKALLHNALSEAVLLNKSLKSWQQAVLNAFQAWMYLLLTKTY